VRVRPFALKQLRRQVQVMYAKFVQQSIEVPNEVDWTMPAQHERAPVLEVSPQVWDGSLPPKAWFNPVTIRSRFAGRKAP